MKEQLYAIPVNDAFDSASECPVCTMYNELLKNAIDYTLGPSYMEDDVRMETNRLGFCSTHLKLLYDKQNRLGLSLMMLTHMDEVIKDVEKLQNGSHPVRGGLFRKNQDMSPIAAYIKTKSESCFICDRINRVFDRYIATIFHLYRNDDSFSKKISESKGFCMDHYGLLYEKSSEHLNRSEQESFCAMLDNLFLANFKRVRDDLDWYTCKFDYRFVNEPWKNSKDALQRSMLKVNSVQTDDTPAN